MKGFNLTERKLDSLRTDKAQEVFQDSKVRGFAVRVSGATGAKVFVVRYTVDGARKISTIGDYPTWSVKDAREAARRIQEDAREGIDNQEEKREAKSARGLTVGDFWPRFMESKSEKLSASTVSSYTSLWEAHICGPWSDRRMSSVKRSDVDNLLRRKAHEATTHNHVRSLILNMWNVALSTGFGGVENNPANKYPKVETLARRRHFTRGELVLLQKGFSSAPLVIGAVFQMALLTVQRQGQVRQMRWADIEGPTWKCPAEFTKGKRPQWIPLSEAALAVLETVRGLDDVWCFPAMRDDNSSGHVGTLSHQFGKLADAEGLEDARCHDLRTTFGTFALQPLDPMDPALPSGLGIPLAVVSECLSHKPDALAFDRYASTEARAAHLIVERRTALSAWADFISKGEK